MLGLCEVALDDLVAGWAMLGGIGVGKPGPGGVVAVFYGGSPGEFDWKACGSVEVADEGANAGEVVDVEGGRVCRIIRIDRWICVGMIFGAEREAPKFGTGGVSPAFE